MFRHTLFAHTIMLYCSCSWRNTVFSIGYISGLPSEFIFHLLFDSIGQLGLLKLPKTMNKTMETQQKSWTTMKLLIFQNKWMFDFKQVGSWAYELRLMSTMLKQLMYLLVPCCASLSCYALACSYPAVPDRRCRQLCGLRSRLLTSDLLESCSGAMRA